MKKECAVMLILLLLLSGISVCAEAGDMEIFEYNASGIAKFTENERYGLINLEGEVIQPAEFRWITIWYSDGLARATGDGRIVLINESGEIVHESPEESGIKTEDIEYAEDTRLHCEVYAYRILDDSTSSVISKIHSEKQRRGSPQASMVFSRDMLHHFNVKGAELADMFDHPEDYSHIALYIRMTRTRGTAERRLFNSAAIAPEGKLWTRININQTKGNELDMRKQHTRRDVSLGIIVKRDGRTNEELVDFFNELDIEFRYVMNRKPYMAKLTFAEELEEKLLEDVAQNSMLQ